MKETEQVIGQTQRGSRNLPRKGYVLAWSANAKKWCRINVRFVRENPAVYPQWREIHGASKA